MQLPTIYNKSKERVPKENVFSNISVPSQYRKGKREKKEIESTSRNTIGFLAQLRSTLQVVNEEDSNH